ncbi:hypothetical protein [Portibacter marinus]|uniref:hypothetical protein n=1 Tax=Portibacter marinus TaxID=2898660 RepID=UPI001F313A63|nr:hypothetical protein [Portibacter marinus]
MTNQNPAHLYIHHIVKLCQDHHKKSIDLLTEGISMKEFMEIYAKEIEEGFKNKKLATAKEISNYYPPLLGKSDLEIFNSQLSKASFLDIAACIHGFEAFSKIQDVKIDGEFEKSVNALLAGDYDFLRGIVNMKPQLVHQRSNFGHGAYLLHYGASNAVELYRQVVPLNLGSMIELLLGAGAEKDSEIEVYGGSYTFLDLFNSSAHPRAAGIMNEVNALFS